MRSGSSAEQVDRARRARTRIRSRRAARDGPGPAGRAAARPRRPASTTRDGAARRRRGSRRRCAGTPAARGWPGTAAPRARARPQRQHELLPRVAGAVDEPRRRREDLVARRAAARAAARRARAPSARRRRARGARRRGRRWRCGDRAAGVRVGVDGRSLVGGGARGVAHYTAALLEALASAYPDDEYRVLLPRGRGDGPARASSRSRHALPARVLFGAAAVDGPPAARRAARRLRRRLGARAGAAGGRREPRSCSRSTTARGRSARRTSRATSALWHAAARPRRLARRAARVLCDTEVVRGELIREWGLEPDRVRTAPLAPRRAAAAASAPEPRARYFLSVGALEPRKAPDVLVAGFRLARERGLDAELIVAGDGRLAPSRRPGVRRLGHVEDLGSLYAGALARRAPVVARGLRPDAGRGHRRAARPAIVSDLPVLREVLGDGALYVRAGRRGRPRRRAAARRGRPGAARAAAGRAAARRSRRSAGPRPRAAHARGAGRRRRRA